MADKTLGEIARQAHDDLANEGIVGVDFLFQAVADAVVAAHEARRWRAISEYAGEDWAHVLYDGKVYIAGRDTWGGKTFWKAPSLWVLPNNIDPTHFMPFPAPPKEASDAE